MVPATVNAGECYLRICHRTMLPRHEKDACLMGRGWLGHHGVRLGVVTLLCVAVSILIRHLEVVCIDFFEPRGVSMPLVSHLAFGGLHRLWLVAIADGVVWLAQGRGWLSRHRARQLWRGLLWAIAISIGLGLGAIGLELGILAQSIQG